MKIYLLKNIDPCFDCNTEDVIGVYDDPELAIKDLQKINKNGSTYKIDSYDINTIVTNSSYPELK